MTNIDKQIDLMLKAAAETRRLRKELEASSVVHMSKSNLAYLIAEAIAEALREAADRAVNLVKLIRSADCFDELTDDKLRAAITLYCESDIAPFIAALSESGEVSYLKASLGKD
jgi:uncharacterized protein (DUF1810 family)